MKTFRKIMKERITTEQRAETEPVIEKMVQDKVIVEIEENPLVIIRDFGYKIRLETPKKYGTHLLFFREKDADDAFVLVDGLYKNYIITKQEKTITIKNK